MTLANSRQGGPRLIPVLLDDSRPPGFLANYNVVDFRTTAPFADRITQLADAIRGVAPARIAALTVPNELAFLTFFPEGLIDALFRELIRRRGLAVAAADAEARGIILLTEALGVDFRGLAPALVAATRDTIQNQEAEALSILEAVESCFADEDPFDDDQDLGRGRALLLRDLLGLAVAARDSAGITHIEKLRQLARSLLLRIVNEGEIRIAFEISTNILALAFAPSPLDYLVHGSLLLQLGQAGAALAMLDLYRGDAAFKHEGISDPQRMMFTLNWAKAVKDAGQGRALHAQVVEACGLMLDLAHDLLDHGHDDGTRLLKADLLNSRATQLAVFGTQADWIGALADLHEVVRTYQQLGELERLLDAHANLVSHVLDRAATTAGDVDALLRDTDQLESDVSPQLQARSFFFLYQKARLLHRVGRDSDAREMYGAAEGMAEQTQPYRAPLARWKILRLRRSQDDISENDYLEGLLGCARGLEPAASGDAWSANALSSVLVDVARVQVNRKANHDACRSAARALELRLARMRATELPSARERAILLDIVTLVEKIGPAFSLDQCLGPLQTERLKKLTNRPPYRDLRLEDLKAWLSGTPQKDR